MNIFNIIQEKRRINFFHNPKHTDRNICRLCNLEINRNSFKNKVKCVVYINKAIIIQKNYRLYKLRKLMPILWRIAEFYVSVKYHPNNINIDMYC